MANELSKYWGYFLLEFKRTSFYWPELILRTLLIVLRLILPYSIFSILAHTNRITLEQSHSALWAILIGQIIYGSALNMSKSIKNEVRTGEINIRLTEPVIYVLAKMSMAMGKFVPYFFSNVLLFFPIFILLFPSNINYFELFSFSIVSALICNLISLNIGLTSFLIEENEGVVLISQKLFMIFGNQMIPVMLMPLWTQTIAKYTPFYLGLAGPIEVAAGRWSVVAASLSGFIYIVLFLLLAQWQVRVIRRRMITNG